METYEMRYFLEVAKQQNIHKASETLLVSPASLSKAVARLEEELGVKLFSREGRGIRITDQGKLLKLRVAHILDLEQSAKIEISGQLGNLQVIFAGPEVALSIFAPKIAEDLIKRHKQISFEYRVCDEEKALAQVSQGDAHLAIVASDLPSGLSGRLLAQSKFQTVVGRGHPLYARASAKKAVPVSEILEHAFVGPSSSLLGKVGLKQSLDGWRDDQFPRKVSHLSTARLSTKKSFGMHVYSTILRYES